MGRLGAKINRLFVTIENRPYDAFQVLFVIFFVGLWRLALETLFGGENFSFDGLIHFPVFYLQLYFYFATAGSYLTGQDWRRTANLTMYGILIGTLPPLIDTAVYGSGNYRYTPFREVAPLFWAEGFPIGETITIWLSILALGFYVWIRSRSAWRGLAGVAAGYPAFIWITYILFQARGGIHGAIASTAPEAEFGVLTIALLVVTFVNYILMNWTRLRSSVWRVNHALPWVAVVLIGARLTSGIAPLTWMLALIVLIVHQTAIFANDYYDRDADELEGRRNGVNIDDVVIFHTISVWLGLSVMLIRPIPGVLLLLYFTATAAYHHRAVRLKNICPINYKTEGLVGACALAIGVTSVAAGRLSPSGLLALFLAFGGFSLVSMLKDYKDLESDRVFSVRTIYLILTQRGWEVPAVHRLVTIIVTVCLAIPVFWLLARGESVFPVLLCAAIFVLPVPYVLLRQPPKPAVETSIWLITGYLFAMVWLAPVGVILPA